MIVKVNERIFETEYFPFFRIEQHDDFQVWCMRLPSGKVEDVLVFDIENPTRCLNEYAEYLVREYLLEDDIALTQRAIEFKNDIGDLFYEKRC